MNRSAAMFAFYLALFVAPGVASAQQTPAAQQTPPDAPTGGQTVAGGEAITISGGGFRPGSQVTISGACIPNTIADVTEAGEFRVSVEVLEEAAPGECVVAIKGEGLDNQPRTVEQRLNVAGVAAPQTAPPPEPPQEVAETGIDTGAALLLAAALLLFGAGSLLWGREPAHGDSDDGTG